MRKITIDQGNTTTKLAMFKGTELMLKEENISLNRVQELVTRMEIGHSII